VRIVRRIIDLHPLGGDVGLVPTMGALHAGHEALIARAAGESDTVVVSVFVNPAQFGDAADLAAYPRDLDADAAVAEAAGADVLFAPAVDEMYPSGFQTWVDVEELSRRLEGEHRPGHFRGVATICLKLFNIVRPRRAYFGQKDAQQLAVLRRMVRDLEVASPSSPCRQCATGTGWRCPRETPASPLTNASARWRCLGPSPRATSMPHALPSPIWTWTTWRSPTSNHPFSPPPFASATPV